MQVILEDQKLLGTAKKIKDCVLSDGCFKVQLTSADTFGLSGVYNMHFRMKDITGVIVGIMQKKLSSSTGFEGLLKKGLILIIVSIGHILDTQLFGGESSVCRSAIIGFYIANEGISILENVGKMGLPLPEKLKKVLEQLKNDSER